MIVLAFGILDAAHCLSAMLPAAATGNDQLGIPLQTSLVLSTNRAFISLSQKLCYELKIHTQDTAQASAVKVVQALKQGDKIQLAHVFKQSIHHYCLREWLALADPDLQKNTNHPHCPLPIWWMRFHHNSLMDFVSVNRGISNRRLKVIVSNC